MKVMENEPTDAMLDDLLYRQEYNSEVSYDPDEEADEDDNLNDDSCGDY